jgi:hypothetical protein
MKSSHVIKGREDKGYPLQKVFYESKEASHAWNSKIETSTQI